MNEASAVQNASRCPRNYCLQPESGQTGQQVAAKRDACFNAEGMEKCEQSAHLCLRLLQTREETETDQRLHAPPCAYNCDLLPPINFIRNVGVVYLKISNILTYYTLEISLSQFRW